MDVVGRVVKSKSGHDKGKFYLIVAVVDDKHVAVANGVSRKLNAPKKKNLRHLEVAKMTFPELSRLLASEQVSANLAVREYLEKLD